MINVKELRIGSRILDPFDKEAVVEKLVIIHTYGTIALSAIDGSYQVVTFICDDCNPIPLTEEMLVSMGFIKQSNNWKCLCICNDWIYLYWENLAGLKLTVGIHSFMLPHIKYLHQIQNLYFAFTGEELEVKESKDE